MTYGENSQKNLPSQKIHNYSKSFEKKERFKMDIWFTICLNLFITAFAYLFVPTVLCICRAKMTLSRIKLIVGINGICFWLMFMIIRLSAGIEGTSYAVVLWSSIAYLLMKKYCLKDSNDNKPVKRYVVKQIKKVNLSNTQEQKSKKNRLLIFIIIALSILLVGSVTYNVIQYVSIKKHTEGIKYLEENVLSTFIMDDDEENTFYAYDYETHKYLDGNGNEYKE